MYGEIFTQLLELSKKQPLHSEKIIGKIIINNKISMRRVKFNFQRVRFDGHIDTRDSF
jgi:hypothetical protein